MSTHRVDEDESNRNLERSEERKRRSRLTESYGHVEAKSGVPSASETSHTSPDAGGAYPGKIPAQHDTAEVEDTRSRALSITRAATYHIWTPLDAAAQGRWTLLIVHSILILFIGI